MVFESFKNFWGYMRREKLEVMIIPSIDKAGEAESIFKKYNAKKIMQMGVDRLFGEGGFQVYANEENPDKVVMKYIIDHEDFDKIGQEFCDASIAGFNRHNKIYHEPFGLRKKLFSLLREYKQEKIKSAAQTPP